jgi:hypothetical protein
MEFFRRKTEMSRRLLFLAAITLSVIACSFGAAPKAPTEDTRAKATIQALEATLKAKESTLAAVISSAVPPPAPQPKDQPAITLVVPPPLAQGGVVSGALSYPSEMIPAQRIVAFDVNSMLAVKSVTTQDGQNKFTLPLPAGDYYIVAYTLDGKLAAGYTQAVPCGLSVDCTDHSLIAVMVANGGTVGNISPADWYAPEGTFPSMP